MSRFQSALTWLGLASLSVLGLNPGVTRGDTSGPNAPPNVVFILADDWGWGDLGCYGHPSLRTPNLDRLAAQGTLLTQFYQCGSVCSPSRTALMTGRYPARFGIHGHLATHDQNAARGMPDWLDANAATLPKILKARGYATGHFGKWHLGHNPGAPLPSAYGFDESRVSNVGPTTDWDLSGPELRPRSTELIVDAAIRFVEKHRGGPFYVQTWLMDTHANLNPTDGQLAAYPKLKANSARFSAPAQVYQAAATDADRLIGRLLKALDDLGLSKNTLVMFTSDNGPEAIEVANAAHSGVGSPGPFRGRKRSLYEGGVRLPFLIRGPGIPAGRVSDAIVAGSDLLPTIAALTGSSLPDGLSIDGEDRSAVLRGEDQARKAPLMWEWRFGIAGHVQNRSPILAIRDGRWKLLMNPDRSRVELYAIPDDPGEVDNVADHHPEIVARLADRVLAWQKTLPAGPIDPGAGSNAYPWPRAKPAARP